MMFEDGIDAGRGGRRWLLGQWAGGVEHVGVLVDQLVKLQLHDA